ncbi:VCBS repeat-containing protein [Cyclobacterium sp.]|uniref:FG-GAP repeat domain-containing protein n=1 Tax=Cyclobacterium sp. TaxID=1966343 RepID=UPI0019846F52|nr:VCBS repeat-containing protein [Cyclobacterium sp.]MBD3629362.1 VCBS repeat-containing protein [Cyclobacterium sp.]
MFIPAPLSSKIAASLIILIGTILLPPSMGQDASGVPASEISFRKHTLSNTFLAEGAAIGDVNQDGLMDVMAGAYWFEAPDWTPHELEVPQEFQYDKGYSNAFISYGMDVNQDGWVDFVRIGFPGKEVQWFENPKNKPGHWEVHLIHESLGNESAGFFDVDKDGIKDLVGSIPETGEMVWFRAPSRPDDLAWKKYPISEKKSPGTAQFSHGLGMGDINGDGRKDLLITGGWWEAPEDPTKGPWEFHAANLGEPAAQMYVQDFNEDGLPDVVSSSAHKLGIWWHEQKKSGQWETHLIDDSFTQTHGLELVDMNGDGHPDLVTGKRYFAHMGNDPGEYDTPYLSWYAFTPGPEPQWTQQVIDKDSGVGVHVITADFNGNGLIDVVVANKKGVFVFEQVRE